MTKHLIGTLILALSSTPLFVIGMLVARGNLGLINGLDAARVADPHALAGQLARYLFAMGLVLVAGAAAVGWAGRDETRLTWITLVTVVAVNAVAILLGLAIARAKRNYRAAGRR